MCGWLLQKFNWVAIDDGLMWLSQFIDQNIIWKFFLWTDVNSNSNSENISWGKRKTENVTKSKNKVNKHILNFNHWNTAELFRSSNFIFNKHLIFNFNAKSVLFRDTENSKNSIIKILNVVPERIFPINVPSNKMQLKSTQSENESGRMKSNIGW